MKPTVLSTVVGLLVALAIGAYAQFPNSGQVAALHQHCCCSGPQQVIVQTRPRADDLRHWQIECCSLTLWPDPSKWIEIPSDVDRFVITQVTFPGASGGLALERALCIDEGEGWRVLYHATYTGGDPQVELNIPVEPGAFLRVTGDAGEGSALLNCVSPSSAYANWPKWSLSGYIVPFEL
jgi:hypothetical protein